MVGTRATCLGLYDIQGYSPMKLQRYVEFLGAINGVGLNYHDAAILASGIESPLLGLLNPAYVITPYEIPADRVDLRYVQSTMTEVFSNGTIRVFANPNVYPHAWMAHDVRQMPKDDILDAVASRQIDLTQTAIVENQPPAASPAMQADSVTFNSYKPDEMSMQVEANSDGLLVVSEVFAPGWRAYVDGKQVSVYATDYVLRGIPVPAGNHRVELRYEPASLSVGIGISIITGVIVLVILGALGYDLWRRRKPMAYGATAQPVNDGM